MFFFISSGNVNKEQPQHLIVKVVSWTVRRYPAKKAQEVQELVFWKEGLVPTRNAKNN
jgi:hypothetical protein